MNQNSAKLKIEPNKEFFELIGIDTAYEYSCICEYDECSFLNKETLKGAILHLNACPIKIYNVTILRPKITAEIVLKLEELIADKCGYTPEYRKANYLGGDIWICEYPLRVSGERCYNHLRVEAKTRQKTLINLLKHLIKAGIIRPEQVKEVFSK